MPLRAFINEIETISIDLDNARWNELKKLVKSQSSVVRLPCCNQNGYLRTSSAGLKHFVHSKSQNNCDWKPESAEHLKSKIEIIEACKESGWNAIPEYSEENWRADVLATNGTTRIAFEVQWSKQTLEETKFRQERYKNSGVRGCWFFKTAPKEMRDYDENNLKASKEIPAFKIFKDTNSNIQAHLNHEQLTLNSLVKKLLNRHLRVCNKTRAKLKQEVEIILFETSCWKCNEPQHLWTVERNLTTVCNQKFHSFHSSWDNEDLDKSPEVYNALKNYLKSEDGKSLRIGELKKRNSKMAQTTYLSHGCYKCDSIFGDFYIMEEKSYAYHNTKNLRFKVELMKTDLIYNKAHWCFSESNEFCE